MAGLSIWHVVIFAIVIILLFGTSKLKNLGKDVGGAVKDFKKSIREEQQPLEQKQEEKTIQAQINSSETSIKS